LINLNYSRKKFVNFHVFKFQYISHSNTDIHRRSVVCFLRLKMSDERNHENFVGDDNYKDEQNDLMRPQEVADQIAKGGEQVIIKWHNIILKESPKFDAFLEPANTLKNRYPNVILYDQTRVKLLGDKVGDDYYHASYVDSYDRADGYILAQAPFNETTESDFWRMIIQTGTKLIVLLTDIHDQEGNRLVKHFWPESTTNSRSYSESNVKVNYVKSGFVSFIFNFQFSNSCVHRSGTYAVLDIVLDRIKSEKKV
ncbi:Protein-tyrosine phosphatase, partial [Onchocerca flexuosa]